MRRSIAREHLLGAIVWAYAGGSATVKQWSPTAKASRFRRVVT
ncbi:hypothetical protein [Haloarcula amylovorans]|nr:hypothetical protein [Halomicroarcula amylolytica]